MDATVLQRVLEVAAQQWAHKPALLAQIQRDAALGELCPHLRSNPWVVPTVSLEADGLIKSSFVNFQIQGFIEEWATGRPNGKPAPGPAAMPVAEAPPAQEAAIARSELVRRFKPRWPSIESDLAYCQMNGLHRAKSGHYDWLASVASAWARQHGKLKDGPDDPNAEQSHP